MEGKDANVVTYPAGTYAYPGQYGYGYAGVPMTTSFAYQAAPATYGSFYYGAPATTVAAPAATTVATRDIASATPVAATTTFATSGHVVSSLPGYTTPAGYTLYEETAADGSKYYRAVPNGQTTVATRDVTVAAAPVVQTVATPVAAATPAVAVAPVAPKKKKSCC